MGDIQTVLHLCCGAGVDLRIGVGRSPGHVAGVSKEPGSPPQQLHTGSLLMSGQVIGELEQVRGLLSKRCALGRNIVIMEAVVRHPELLEELERHPHLRSGGIHRRKVRIQPGPIKRAFAKDVVAGPVERMPVADRHAEVFSHGLAANNTVGVVPAERQRVIRIRPFETDRFGHGREEVGHRSPVSTGGRVLTRRCPQPQPAAHQAWTARFPA